MKCYKYMVTGNIRRISDFRVNLVLNEAFLSYMMNGSFVVGYLNECNRL